MRSHRGESLINTYTFKKMILPVTSPALCVFRCRGGNCKEPSSTDLTPAITARH